MRRFLFLQGPISPFFAELGAELRRRGHAVHRINLSLGDRLFWRGPGAVDYRGRLGDWPAFVEAFLDRRGITDLVLLGEQRVYHRVAIAAAARRGVAVTATDFGYIRPHWVILERDGHNAMSRFPRDPAAIRRLAQGAPPLDRRVRFPDAFARQARWDMAFHLANLLPWPFPHFETHLIQNPVPVYAGTGVRLATRRLREALARRILARIPAQAPFFLFAMQMEMDFSLRAYSPFPDLDTPMEEAVRSFAAHAPAEAHLAFKVHPLDPGLKAWSRRVARMAGRAGVPGRVHLLDGLPLDPLVERAAGVLTVNSTSAIRAIELGRPVLAMGEALFRVPGLSHESGLDRFWTAPAAPDPGLADAFLRAIAQHLHVVGGYYHPDAIAAAVPAAADRLEAGRVGPPETAAGHDGLPFGRDRSVRPLPGRPDPTPDAPHGPAHPGALPQLACDEDVGKRMWRSVGP